MYLTQQQQLEQRLRAALRDLYQIEVESVVIEQPDLAFGEYATPLAFELARRLRKAPRKIAEEIVAALGVVPAFSGFEVAGAGYINARLDRAALIQECALDRTRQKPLIFANVEHTSINPNKAAHIGHLRNAILGDTWARLLKAASGKPDTVIVQNYIDNTGVQVADVVVGLIHLKNKRTVADVAFLMEELILTERNWQRNMTSAMGQTVEYLLDLETGEEEVSDEDVKPIPIDYYFWDLYAKVSSWYKGPGKEGERKKIRLDILHAIEAGGNETAQIADLVSTAIMRRHIETMLRLGIEYDFLPRESEILHLHFWEKAFEQLKSTGVLYYETRGKNSGCWVMTRSGSSQDKELKPQSESTDREGPDEDAKVIVRSNGTVTYVGKDIAYHLWKFHLLEDCEFGDEVFFTYPDGRQCYRSVDNRPVDANGVPYGTGIPVHFKASGADYVFNVIDARQADAQANVKEAIRGMGYAHQANRLQHFTYEMVALTPRCALDLGYEVSEEDRARPYIEVSGRKGFGVKADDLIDKLVAATRAEVGARHPELSEAERDNTARAIAVGALRYFMLRFTRNSVIAFDFKDALSFEGETGPYLQYAAVRTRSIFRKAGTTPEAALASIAGLDLAPFLSGPGSEGIWEVWLRAAKTTLLLEQCIQTAEPAYLAKHAFQLAQDFSNFYRLHHILSEEDPARKALLLATAAVTQRELIRSLAWLGISAPEVM